MKSTGEMQNIVANRSCDGTILFINQCNVVSGDIDKLIRIQMAVIPKLVAIASKRLCSDDIELVDCVFFDVFDDCSQKDFAKKAIRLMDEKHFTIDEACNVIGAEVFHTAVVQKMLEMMKSRQEEEKTK